MMRLALFADLHGKCLLPFKLAAHYQAHTGHKIDAILQCGDIGVFPDRQQLDKATLRHARTDRDELGFMDDFVRPKAEIARFLDSLDVNMYCVRGNHEDHAFLDRLEAAAGDAPAFAIDAYRRIWVCQTGLPLTLHHHGESLSLVGVGRIGDRKGREHPPYVQAYERRRLQALQQAGGAYDVLLSHDQAGDRPDGYGMAELNQLLDHIPFAWHFYGHTGAPYHQQWAGNGNTRAVKIRELEFNRQGKLEAGAMLILEKSGNQMQLTPVPLADIIHFMRATWHYL